MQNELADEFYREQKVKRDNELQQMEINKATNRAKANNIMGDLPTDLVKYIMEYHDDGPQKTKDHLDAQNNEYATRNKNRKTVIWALTGTNPADPLRTGTHNGKIIGENSLNYITWHRNFGTNDGAPSYDHMQY